MKIKKLTFLWPILGILTLLLRWLASSFPQATESIYSRGLFVAVRYIWDYSLGLLPLPLLYLLFLVLLILLVKRTRTWYRGKKRFQGFLLGFASLLGFVITSFFLLWGFNYARQPLPQQLGLTPPQQAGDSLSHWLNRASRELISAREQLPFSMEDSLPPDVLPQDMTNLLRHSLGQNMTNWGIPPAGSVKAKAIAPKGWLIGLGASGIYLPWTGQGQYDASLHHLEVPVTAAHEMGHALGFTDEGVCNFLGYLACIDSKEPTLAYAGRLAVWRALARSAYVSKTELYHESYGQLPAGIRADLAGIRRRQKQYRGWFPDFSRLVYDSYLKQQGVEGGITSYGRGVLLWESYRYRR